MVELGKYAGTVLTAYGITIFLLAALVGASLWRAARVKRQLAETEQKNG